MRVFETGGREAFDRANLQRGYSWFHDQHTSGGPRLGDGCGSIRSHSREACRERGKIEEWALQLQLSRRALFASRQPSFCATSELFLRLTSPSNTTMAMLTGPAGITLTRHSRPTGCSRSGNEHEETPSSIPHLPFIPAGSGVVSDDMHDRFGAARDANCSTPTATRLPQTRLLGTERKYKVNVPPSST